MHNRYPIIPKPASLEPKSGNFVIRTQTQIITHPENWDNALYLRDFLSTSTGVELPIRSEVSRLKNYIRLSIDESLEKLKQEGYQLSVNSASIEISAIDSKGIFYGIQTLRQLLPPEAENKQPVTNLTLAVPCCEIMDLPRFSWRGYMLDEGRHFHGTENIRRTIDLMALQKLNVFHWHLTEDQGWRIEIRAYPKLTEIGSWRPGTASSIFEMLKGEHNNVPHSGFYTQKEIRDVVLYAAQRNITIVPEIEIPGHSMAALTAYPELSCTGGPFDVPTRFGIFKDVYCPGKEPTYEFIKTVLEEITTLFPSSIIHIGGDEAPTARWKVCPDCQRRIRTLGLSGENELRSNFLDKIIDYLSLHSRRVMGWNEIIHNNLTQNAIIQYWIGSKKRLHEAVKKGNEVVISAYLDMYLDHSYSLTSLRRADKFEPVLKILDDYSKNVIGLEAPLWTEWIPNQARLDYQTYPRLTAYAETGWTPSGKKSYPDFIDRLYIFKQRLDIIGVKYAKPEDWDPKLYKQLLGFLTIAQAQTKTSY